MFNQSVENTVDRLCAELHASELESGIIRAYFRIDPRIREPFMQRMIQEMQSEYAALAPVSAESEQSEPVQPVEQKTPPPFPRVGWMTRKNFSRFVRRIWILFRSGCSLSTGASCQNSRKNHQRPLIRLQLTINLQNLSVQIGHSFSLSVPYCTGVQTMYLRMSRV